MLHIGTLGRRRSTRNRRIRDATFQGIVPDGLHLLYHALGILLVACNLRHYSLRHNIGENAIDKGMLLVDVSCKKPAEIVQFALTVQHTEETVVGRPVVDSHVFHIHLLVIDIAGKCKVGGALLAYLVQLVVFPLHRRMEGIAHILHREYLLENSDVVEIGRVDGDTQHRVAGRCRDRHGEEGIGVVIAKVLVAEAGHAHHQRRIELVLQIRVVRSLEVHQRGVEHLGLDMMARYRRQCH